MWQWRSPRTSAELDERGRLAAERLLAELRRAPRNAERCVDSVLVTCVGQPAERLDVVARARSQEQLGPEAARVGEVQNDGNALDRHADGATRGGLDDHRDLRKASKRLQNLLWASRGDDDGEVERHVRPPARVAGDLAAERASDLFDETPGTVEQDAAG